MSAGGDTHTRYGIEWRLEDACNKLDALNTRLDQRFRDDDRARGEIVIRVDRLEQRISLYNRVIAALGLAVLGVVANAIRAGIVQ